MQIIIPNSLYIVYASVEEENYPVWDESTPYSLGNIVIYAHVIYQCVLDNSIGQNPFEFSDFENAPWRTISPTLPWRCVDLYGYSQTRAAEGETELEIWVPFARPATAVYLMNMDATSVTITLEDSVGEVVYESTPALSEDSNGWHDYWFGLFFYKKDVGLIDLPPVTGTLKLRFTGERPAIGRIIVGERIVFAETEYGAQGGLIDYSVVTTDAHGREVWVKRHNARKSSFSALIDPDQVNYVQQIVSRSLTGMPALFIADNNAGYEPLIVFGFLREYDATYLNVSTVRVTLDVRGIT